MYNGTSQPLPGAKCDHWTYTVAVEPVLTALFALDVLQTDPTRPVAYNVTIVSKVYGGASPLISRGLKALEWLH